MRHSSRRILKVHKRYYSRILGHLCDKKGQRLLFPRFEHVEDFPSTSRQLSAIALRGSVRYYGTHNPCTQNGLLNPAGLLVRYNCVPIIRRRGQMTNRVAIMSWHGWVRSTYISSLSTRHYKFVHSAYFPAMNLWALILLGVVSTRLSSESYCQSLIFARLSYLMIRGCF